MATLLFEIGCEELPASACRAAEAELPALCAEHLGEAPASVYVTPRRLAALVEDLPEHEPDEWVKGPPVHVGEEAAAGFARRRGVSRESLDERDGFLGVVVPGKPLRDTLPERIDAIVRGLVFAKTMRWDASGARFPRPIRWRCVKLDGETLEGGRSPGRRFAAGPVEIPNAAAYPAAR
ncbi:MAG TPA: glycine--tRNA ligase subunit beta, partial [Gaiellaceae bacterium]|nr:glycine--tRNA ligase subunit beta [Gaiellaceae bacterium]